MTTRPDATDEARAAQAAAALWPTMNANQRAGVRVGLIPLGIAQLALIDYGTTRPAEGVVIEYADFPRLFALALMNEAARDGGMIA